jgi:hypothetical protein
MNIMNSQLQGKTCKKILKKYALIILQTDSDNSVLHIESLTLSNLSVFRSCSKNFAHWNKFRCFIHTFVIFYNKSFNYYLFNFLFLSDGTWEIFSHWLTYQVCGQKILVKILDVFEIKGCGCFHYDLLLYILYYDQLIFWNFRTHRYVGLSLWLSFTTVNIVTFRCFGYFRGIGLGGYYYGRHPLDPVVSPANI